MEAVIGLGNPGAVYERTRHNVGFRTIEVLAEKNGIQVTKFRHRAFVGEGSIEGKRVLLIKPQTYMNLSGESVREVMQFYKIPLENLLVIFDDISLPLGAIRIREKGTAGGHNGIKSIISQLGTTAFCRIKVGVGEKPNGWDLADYVLGRFSEDEEAVIRQGIDRAAEAAQTILKSGCAAAMNLYNGR